MNFSRSLKASRVASNKTQEDMAKVLGVSRATFAKKEADPALFTVGELKKLQKGFNEEGCEIASKSVNFFLNN